MATRRRKSKKNCAHFVPLIKIRVLTKFHPHPTPSLENEFYPGIPISEFGGQRCPLPCPAPVLPRFFRNLTARCPALPRFFLKNDCPLPCPAPIFKKIGCPLPCPATEAGQGQCCPEFRCPDFRYDSEFLIFRYFSILLKKLKHHYNSFTYAHQFNFKKNH